MNTQLIDSSCRKCQIAFSATAKYLRDKRHVCLVCHREYAKKQARKYRKTAKHAAYIKSYYETNRSAYQARGAQHKQSRKDIIAALKNVPCTDCGQSYHPCVMDFDHVDGTKVNNVGHMLRAAGMPAILEEISKCEVVCSNCHRLRTHGRQRKHGTDVQPTSIATGSIQ